MRLRSLSAAGLALLLAGCQDGRLPTMTELGVPLFSTAATAGGVVISQVYGAGGNSGATFTHDYVELYNAGSSAASLEGWSVQYASATGTGAFGATSTQLAALSGSIAPGGYYLVRLAGGSTGSPLPVSPDAEGSINMSGTSGKVALVKQATSLGCNGGSSPCSEAQLAQIADLVGFGGANFYEGSGPAPTLGASTAAFRKGNGCTDTDDNASDFGTAAPSPRNSGTPAAACDVTPAQPASVTVEPSSATAFVGTTHAFTARAFDADRNPLGGVTFTWTSSAPEIATVDENGVATAVSAGSATITARTPDGVSGTATLTVSESPLPVASNVIVSEFHYDNNGTDAGEAIELQGDAGGSLLGWRLVLYSGSSGSTTQGQFYREIPLTGTFPSSCGERGVLVFEATGLQNGDQDGFALVNAAGEVVEFLSYEGSFVAVNGPAAGMTSTDVGVQQSSSTPTGRSLQRAGNGTWFGPYTWTFGACNADTPPPPQVGVTFSGRLPSDPALPVGFQDQLFARLIDENSGGEVATTFTWSSETPAIASIDQRGVITARTAGTAVFRATAADGTSNTLSLQMEVAPAGNAALYKNALTFGLPTDADPSDDLRVSRPQYELSYDRGRNTANWVAYHLSRASRGDMPGYRCDCFTTDPEVTAPGEVGITTADYTGSGFDRGHLVRSNDRELGRLDQATTYYLSNIAPQYANNNQGRWGDLESYLQTVTEGPGEPEVYIFAGPRGEAGRIANGRIAVPTHFWKVAVVLPAGMSPASVDDPSDILDVIAVDMPNVSNLPRDGNWRAHLTTVDAIEAATGYDFLARLPDALERFVERGHSREDVQTLLGQLSAGVGSAADGGIATSLQAKLDAARRAFGQGNLTAAANQLTAFRNEVGALEQSGGLSAEQAASLRGLADRVLAMLRD